MERDRKISEVAQAARKGFSDIDMTLEAEQIAWLASNSVNQTDTSSKYDWGIEPLATVVAVFKGRGGATAGFIDQVQSSSEEIVGLILDKSPFYYESGGQINDTGLLTFVEGNTSFVVENVQVYGGFVVHLGRLQAGQSVAVGTAAKVSVDYSRRSLIAPNHTMTHVLNYSLKRVLLGGEESNGLIDQKGSLVDTEKLRFDFSWNGAISKEQLAEIETIVRKQISDALPVYSEVVGLADASQINGLRKVFGERYPDPVRVISVGADIAEMLRDPTSTRWTGYSIEFCGGTHLTNTKEAEDFVIIEESGISKGIRRVVGLTRGAAKHARERASAVLGRLTELEAMTAGPELQLLSKSLSREVTKFISLFTDVR